jgi:hypothetical protein
VVTSLDIWRNDRSDYPTDKLLLALDSLNTLQILSGHLTGSAEPAMVVHLLTAVKRFTDDRQLDFALQHVASHFDLKYNELADKRADDGAACDPGTYRYFTHSSDYFSALAELPPLEDWPEGYSSPPRHKPGTQTVAYQLYNGAAWLSGIGRHLIGCRLIRWWPSYINSFWVLHCFISSKEQRQGYYSYSGACYWAKGPLGADYGLIAPRSAAPCCRFCGTATDCVTQWFGPQSCETL